MSGPLGKGGVAIMDGSAQASPDLDFSQVVEFNQSAAYVLD